MHPQILRELAKPLSIIPDKSWLSDEVQLTEKSPFLKGAKERCRELQAGLFHLSAWQDHGADPSGKYAVVNWLDDHTPRVVVSGLKFRWRPVTSCVPWQVVLKPALFNTFFKNMHSGIEGTVSKFADNTKPRAAVNALKGR